MPVRQISVSSNAIMTDLLQMRREQQSDPTLREIRNSVKEMVTEILNKKITPVLMVSELVTKFMDILQAYKGFVLELEQPNVRLLGGMARWRRHDVLRTDARAQRDNMSGYLLKGIGVCALLVIMVIGMLFFGAVFMAITRYFTPS